MPKQSLKAIVRLLRGACPERHEILRYAQNDTKRRARNDKGIFLCSFQTASLNPALAAEKVEHTTNNG